MSLSSLQWKWLLACFGLLIVVGSAVSAGYLVRRLASEERAKVERWVEAQRYIRNMSDEEAAVCDLTIYTEILQSNTTIPLILVNADGNVIDALNFGGDRDEDMDYIEAQLAEVQAAGLQPVTGGENRIYFLESRLLKALRYFPFVQLLLIGSFVIIGYFVLNAVRRSEQNRVWVGMAKETAHQLGTPISAIMAWVEYLRAEYADHEELETVADELNRDVDRLQLVAERFNKIGSTPELTPEPVAALVNGVYSYMSVRAPRKVNFTVEVDPSAAAVPVNVNRPLLEWVLENLIRNALDAMDGSGTLQLRAFVNKDQAEIEVQDSGKGIPSSKRKSVFRPGYTTKSRGWGLGLSLAKRIVEEYHGGKISVKESTLGEGTTFWVRLPVVG